jgi:spermidine synthase
MEIEVEVIDSEVTSFGLLELARYRAPDGQTGYEIRIDGAFLMASHGSASERAMAVIARARLDPDRTGVRVLIGGLGAGHTLRAALDLPGVARVVVAEIGTKVVEWNRRHFAGVNGAAVDDPRVAVVIADVLKVIRSAPASWDMILLDVDNGPGWLASSHNAVLYGPTGLDAARAALRPEGVLAIWSPGSNPNLAATLEEVFGGAEAIGTEVFSRAEGEPANIVYVAQKPQDVRGVKQ